MMPGESKEAQDAKHVASMRRTATDNPTSIYRPTGTGAGWGWGMAALDGKPFYTWFDVPRMIRDPRVRFLERMWRSPFQQATWTVKATHPKVQQYVDSQLKKFWRESLPALLQRYFWFGFAPGGAEFSQRKGLVRLDGVRPLEPLDARPLLFHGGPHDGRMAGLEFGTTKVYLPHAFWFSGEKRFGPYYDMPPAGGMFEPWAEKRGRNGAIDMRRTWFHKNSSRGIVVRHPPGRTESSDEFPGGRDNQSIARELIDYSETNSSLTLTNEKHPSDPSHFAWEVEWPESFPDRAGFREYPKDLDAEMAEGVGIPREVLEAAATGSGYSGRQIPLQAWLGGVDEYVGMLLRSCEWLKWAVMINFGPNAYFEVETESLVKKLLEDSKGPGGMGGAVQNMVNPQPQPGGDAQGKIPPGMVPHKGPRGGGGYEDPNTGRRRYLSDERSPSDELSEEQIARRVAKMLLRKHREEQAALELSDGRTPDLATHRKQLLVLLAMLEFQRRAHAVGDSASSAPYLEALTQYLKNPNSLRYPLELSWRADETRTGHIRAVGEAEHAGRVLYGARAEAALRAQEGLRSGLKPGERAPKTPTPHANRDQWQKAGLRAREILAKVAGYEHTPEDLQELGQHLPYLPMDRLMNARSILRAKFKGARGRLAQVGALMDHIREQVGVMDQKATEEAKVAEAVGDAVPVHPLDYLAANHANPELMAGKKQDLAIHDAINAAYRGEFGPEMKAAVNKGGHWDNHGGDIAKRFASIGKAIAEAKQQQKPESPARPVAEGAHPALAHLDPVKHAREAAHVDAGEDALLEKVRQTGNAFHEAQQAHRMVGSSQPEKRNATKALNAAAKAHEAAQAEVDRYNQHRPNHNARLNGVAVDEKQPLFVRIAAARRAMGGHTGNVVEEILPHVKQYLEENGHDPRIAGAVAADAMNFPMRSAKRLKEVIQGEETRQKIYDERKEAREHIKGLDLLPHHAAEAEREAGNLYQGDVDRFKEKWSNTAENTKAEKARQVEAERIAKERAEKENASKSAADAYLAAHREGKTLPSLAPDAAREVASHVLMAPTQWHAGTELPKADGPKGIVDRLAKEDSTRFALAKTITEQGWGTDSKYAVKATPAMVEHAKAKGLDKLEGRTPPVEDFIKQALAQNLSPAKIVATKEFADDGLPAVLVQSEDGAKQATLDGRYVANIMGIYPKATMQVAGEGKPVVFMVGDEPVGLVMPRATGDDARIEQFSPHARPQFSDVFAPGSYAPEDIEEMGDAVVAGRGEHSMRLRILGRKGGGYTISSSHKPADNVADREYPNRGEAVAAAKEMLAHAHGIDEDGKLIFKAKGEKPGDLHPEEKARVGYYKDLREKVKAVKGKPQKMAFGDGEKEVHPATEHFGVAKGKTGGWEALHLPSGLSIGDWARKDDAIGHAIATQEMPGADWNDTFADTDDEGVKADRKELFDRARKLRTAFENNELPEHAKPTDQPDEPGAGEAATPKPPQGPSPISATSPAMAPKAGEQQTFAGWMPGASTPRKPAEAKPRARGNYEWRKNKSDKWAWFEGDRQITGAFPNESDGDYAFDAFALKDGSEQSEAKPSPTIKDHPEYDRLNQVYGGMTKQEIDKKLSQMDTDIAQNQHVAKREFNQNGGRRSGPAMAAQAARDLGEEKLLLKAYQNEKFPSEPQAAGADSGPVVKPDAMKNPFREQHDELQKRIDQLTGGTAHAHDKAAKNEAFYAKHPKGMPASVKKYNDLARRGLEESLRVAGGTKAGPKPAAADPYAAASTDHTEDVRNIPKGHLGWVAGHRVRSLGDGQFQVESKKAYQTGTAEEVADRIRLNWRDHAADKGQATAALGRAAAFKEPDWTDAAANAKVAAKKDAIPDGTRAVSLDENTRGRTGSVKIATDPDTGKRSVKLVLDGGTDTTATDFEPLDPKHSWRADAADAPVEGFAQPKPVAKTESMFGEAKPVKASPELRQFNDELNDNFRVAGGSRIVHGGPDAVEHIATKFQAKPLHAGDLFTSQLKKQADEHEVPWATVENAVKGGSENDKRNLSVLARAAWKDTAKQINDDEDRLVVHGLDNLHRYGIEDPLSDLHGSAVRGTDRKGDSMAVVLPQDSPVKIPHGRTPAKFPSESAAKPSDGFNPEQAIKIAADDVSKLRKPDVFRVLDWAPAEHRLAVAEHVKEARPDLAGEVDEVMGELNEPASAKPGA